MELWIWQRLHVVEMHTKMLVNGPEHPGHEDGTKIVVQPQSMGRWICTGLLMGAQQVQSDNKAHCNEKLKHIVFQHLLF